MGIPPALERGANRLDAPTRAHYGTAFLLPRDFPAHKDFPGAYTIEINLSLQLLPDRSSQVEYSMWPSVLGTKV